MRRARNAAIHDRASASVSSGGMMPSFLKWEDDAGRGEGGGKHGRGSAEAAEENATRGYSLIGKLNLTSQAENIRAILDSRGTQPYERNARTYGEHFPPGFRSSFGFDCLWFIRLRTFQRI